MSVTAVPIQPLAKGAVTKLWIAIAVLVLAGAGLSWLGTQSMQRATTKSGVQVRVVDEGRGEPVTRADLFALRLRVRVGGPSGELLQDTAQSGQPLVVSMDSLPPGIAEGLQSMREGGHYQLWVPQRLAMNGPPPPNAPFGPDDKIFFEVNVMQVERGMAALQQLMQSQGGAGAPQGGMSGPPGAGAPPGGPPAAPQGGVESGGTAPPPGNSQ